MQNREIVNWNLYGNAYLRIHEFKYPHAWSYGNMTPGKTDKEKREYIRKIALKKFPKTMNKKFAFRILVGKKGDGPFDVDNVPKLVVDAFCKGQIDRDKSKYKVGLYEDDRLDFVEIIQVFGKRAKDNFTRVEIFAHQ